MYVDHPAFILFEEKPFTRGDTRMGAYNVINELKAKHRRSR
jgi:hypothetical protein